MVVGVAVAGQPDAAAADDDLARLPVQSNRLAPVHRETADRGCVKLRFHHQSPVGSAFGFCRITPLYSPPSRDKSNEFDPPL
jgi:hypothetical protein